MARPVAVGAETFASPFGQPAVGSPLASGLPQVPLAHWVAVFAAVDCCVTPVATLDEALADPQYAARRMVVRDASGTRQYAPPFRMDGHEFAIRRDAPAQGQHGVEVLREAGYDESAIAALVAEGSVRLP